MRRTSLALAAVLSVAGCRTPAYLGGEFSHRGEGPPAKAPMEELARRSKWIFFWGLLGTDKVDVPEVESGFDIRDEVARRFSNEEKIVDMTFEEGTTLAGIVTAFFTIGIVSEKEIVVKGRRVPASPRAAPAPDSRP